MKPMTAKELKDKLSLGFPKQELDVVDFDTLEKVGDVIGHLKGSIMIRFSDEYKKEE